LDLKKKIMIFSSLD